MTVTVQGLDEVLEKLDSLDDPSTFRKPMEQATQHLKRELSRYPPQVSRPQPFKTAKQRRYFFWALREGIIEVPYKRKLSAGLGGAWTISISPDGRRGEVGNNTPYGPLVMGKDKQARYHAAGGWRRVDHVARIERHTVAGFFETQYRRIANE